MKIEERKKMFDHLTFQSKLASDRDKELIVEKIDQLMNSTPSDQLWLFNDFMFKKFKDIVEEDIKINHPIRKALVLENLRLRLFLDIQRHHGLYKDCLLTVIRVSHDLSKREWNGFVKFIDKTFKKINKGKSGDDCVIGPMRMHMLMEKISPINWKKIERYKKKDLIDSEYLELLRRQDWIETADMDSFIKLVVLLNQYITSELGRDRLFQFDILTELESLAEDEEGIRDLVVDYLRLLECDEDVIKVIEKDCFPFSVAVEVLDKFAGEMNGKLANMPDSVQELEEVKEQLSS